MKKATLLLFVVWLFILLAIFPRPSAASSPLRIAVIGDSGSDEYQANDHRGGDYFSTTFNWLEQVVRSNRVFAGAWGTRSEPRRTGYEYNVARSGSTVSNALASGQGVLAKTFGAQIVVISVGTRDMELAFSSLYSRTLTGAALKSWQDGIVNGIKKLAQDVQSVQTIILTVPDMSQHPLVVNSPFYSNQTGLNYVRDATKAINDRITEFSAAAGYTVKDMNAFIASIYAAPDLPFNPFGIGDAPENGLLSDYHPGTRWSCFYANFILEGLVTPLDCSFSATSQILLTDDYITTPKNTSIDVLFTTLLANDYGTGLSVVNGAPPLYGNVVPIAGGGRYTPAPNFTGSDVFTYTAQDAFGATKTARVFVQVGP